MPDPTRPLSQRSPDELLDLLDHSLLLSLEAAEYVSSDRQQAEDLIRDRLVALSDTYTTPASVKAERARRTRERLLAAVRGER